MIVFDRTYSLTDDMPDLLPAAEGPFATLAEQVAVSLFSDSGWWGDTLEDRGDTTGSGLSSLARAVITEDTARTAEDLARTALQWLITDGIAESVEVVATITDGDRTGLELVVSVVRGKATGYPALWEEVAA